VVIHPALPLPEANGRRRPVVELTARCTSVIERAIREAPRAVALVARPLAYRRPARRAREGGRARRGARPDPWPPPPVPSTVDLQATMRRGVGARRFTIAGRVYTSAADRTRTTCRWHMPWWSRCRAPRRSCAGSTTCARTPATRRRPIARPPRRCGARARVTSARCGSRRRRLVRSTMVDADGRFTLSDLPPGAGWCGPRIRVPGRALAEIPAPRSRAVSAAAPAGRLLRGTGVVREVDTTPGTPTTLELNDRNVWFAGVVEDRVLDAGPSR